MWLPPLVGMNAAGWKAKILNPGLTGPAWHGYTSGVRASWLDNRLRSSDSRNWQAWFSPRRCFYYSASTYITQAPRASPSSGVRR